MLLEGKVCYLLVPISLLIQKGMTSLSSLDQFLASCDDPKALLQHESCKRAVLDIGDVMFAPFGFVPIVFGVGDKNDKEPPKATIMTIPIYQKTLSSTIADESRKEVFRYIEAGLSKHSEGKTWKAAHTPMTEWMGSFVTGS